MTEEQILNVYQELVRIYGDTLPNFEHEPIQFAYLLKLHLYTKRLP
jgi:hypothetical protein